jgi:hypothetical protein
MGTNEKGIFAQEVTLLLTTSRKQMGNSRTRFALAGIHDE